MRRRQTNAYVGIQTFASPGVSHTEAAGASTGNVAVEDPEATELADDETT